MTLDTIEVQRNLDLHTQDWWKRSDCRIIGLALDRISGRLVAVGGLSSQEAKEAHLGGGCGRAMRWFVVVAKASNWRYTRLLRYDSLDGDRLEGLSDLQRANRMPTRESGRPSQMSETWVRPPLEGNWNWQRQDRTRNPSGRMTLNL